jgi:hypothetical protein
MSDLISTPKDLVRQRQVVQVWQLMSEKGMSQAEACALVGINERTYQRWAGRQEMVPVIQQLAKDAVQAGLILAINAFPRAVERQAAIASGTVGDPRDSGKAADFLQRLVDRAAAAGLKPDASNDGDDEDKAGFTMTFKPGFTKASITVEKALPPLEATVRVPTDPEDDPSE